MVITDFIKPYRLGEGSKERTFSIKNAEDKKDAAFRFQTEGPENSYLVRIEESAIKQSASRVHVRYKINNSFDEFILATLRRTASYQ